jgi:N-methylhydantoinase B
MITPPVPAATPPAEGQADPDPVVRQIVRNRLLAITDQMRLALQSVSGSPTVTEASDFFTGLYLPDGSFATMGYQVTFEAPPVGALIRHLLAQQRPLRDGDRIIGNDPFVGALHQNDLQMCAPLFADGELIAWAGVMAHETDMGGMDFASWSPQATEIWQEGLRIPAVTLVDAGTLRTDVLDMILAATRLPAQVGLDIRAFIATLNVAAERLAALCRRYGTPVVQAVMTRMVDASESAMRSRLRDLPDGTIRVHDFLEHDGHANRLFTVDLVATKTGDSLALDFSGSSPQAAGFINCSRAGLTGGVAGALIPTLGWDLAWNDGLLRPVTITAPDRLICTALPPAPVGSATVETVWVVSNVVAAALNRLLAAAPAFQQRAQAVCSGTMATFNLGGQNQYGERFGLHLMDPLAGGFGAFADRDGPDAAGPLNTPCPSIADVEVNEQVSPLFYVYRRMAPDSGGPGRRRGGRSAEIALTLAVPEAEALIMTHGAQVPNATGLSGGLPGGTVLQQWASGTVGGDLVAAGSFDPPRLADLGPKPGSTLMTDRDVFAVRWQGGGGVGDPLDRDPADVAEDVTSGAVTPVRATEVYGVIVDGGRADTPATTALRRTLRAARLGVPVDQVPEDPGPSSPEAAPPGLAENERWLSLGGRLRLVHGDDGWRVVTTGGAQLCRDHTRWRTGALQYPMQLPAASGAALHRDLTVTASYCPVTGALLGVDVHLAGTQPAHDLDLDLSPGGIADRLATRRERAHR